MDPEPGVLSLPPQLLGKIVRHFLRGSGSAAVACLSHLGRVCKAFASAALDSELAWRVALHEAFFVTVNLINGDVVEAESKECTLSVSALDGCCEAMGVQAPGASSNRYKLLYALVASAQRENAEARAGMGLRMAGGQLLMLPAPLPAPEEAGQGAGAQPAVALAAAAAPAALQEAAAGGWAAGDAGAHALAQPAPGPHQHPAGPVPLRRVDAATDQLWFTPQHQHRFLQRQLVRAIAAANGRAIRQFLGHLQVLQGTLAQEGRARPARGAEPGLSAADKVALRQEVLAVQGPLPLLATPPAPASLRCGHPGLAEDEAWYSSLQAEGAATFRQPSQYKEMLRGVESRADLLLGHLAAIVPYLQASGQGSLACPSLDARTAWPAAVEQLRRCAALLMDLLDCPTTPGALQAPGGGGSGGGGGAGEARALRSAVASKVHRAVAQLDAVSDWVHALQPLELSRQKLGGMGQVARRATGMARRHSHSESGASEDGEVEVVAVDDQATVHRHSAAVQALLANVGVQCDALQRVWGRLQPSKARAQALEETADLLDWVQGLLGQA